MSPRDDIGRASDAPRRCAAAATSIMRAAAERWDDGPHADLNDDMIQERLEGAIGPLARPPAGAETGIGWGASRPPGTGQGIAFFEGYGSRIAQTMRVSVSAEGRVRVHEVHCAVDVGVAINPSGIRAQVEGGIVDGLSTALKSRISIRDGAVVESGFHDYGWLRIDEMPRVTVEIVAEGSRPGGMGEVGFPAVSLALVNAIHDATGRWLGRLPIKAEDLAGWGVPPAATVPGPDGYEIYVPSAGTGREG